MLFDFICINLTSHCIELKEMCVSESIYPKLTVVYKCILDFGIVLQTLKLKKKFFVYNGKLSRKNKVENICICIKKTILI